MPKTKTAPPALSSAIKGFDANLQCRGFQFVAGETYTHDGPVKACKGGFHAIVADAHPLSVFEYYPPAGSRFFRVEIGGKTDSDDGVKVAAEILKVGTEIGLGDLTREAVEWVLARATLEGPVATKDNGAATASGDQGAATASGYQGAATASGFEGQVKGADGNALFAVERGAWDGRGYPILSVACGIVGRNGIESDTWYRAAGGKLVPVQTKGGEG